VGGSEEKIRALFADARKDQEENGDNAQLHLIIFDEIDSICKKRGTVTGSAGVADTVVNQLLSMIDGVDSLDDVLLIGMTNRKDLIDDAIIRPGRLEVQIEIKLPDEKGRADIFRIHTKALARTNRLGKDVDLNELAHLTPNYTGAEIEGVVKSASSFALQAGVDQKTLQRIADADLTVVRKFFLMALEEVRPAFGVDDNLLTTMAPRGLVNYADTFSTQRDNVARHMNALIHSEHQTLMCLCISGLPGTGLTSFAVGMASQGFDYVKAITAKLFIGRHEDIACMEIRDFFENAYRSRQSAIVIDDLDALIEYSPIGPRFSNKILQSLLVLMKSIPPSGHKLALFVTTSKRSEMEMIGVTSRYFYEEITLAPLTSFDDIVAIAREACRCELSFSGAELEAAQEFFQSGGRSIPVKRAIEALDMAVFEAHGDPVSWRAIELNLLRHMHR
jgi:vesicle-fusing ATPase